MLLAIKGSQLQHSISLLRKKAGIQHGIILSILVKIIHVKLTLCMLYHTDPVVVNNDGCNVFHCAMEADTSDPILNHLLGIPR